MADFPKRPFRTCVERQIFEFFFIITENFYTLVKIKKNYVQVSLSLDSEHYAIQFAIVYWRKIAKLFILFRIFRILGERVFGSKIM